MADGITLENVVKTYGNGDTAVHALRGVNMSVAKGEVVGLIGPSGSGKSTLLKCLGAVIEPSSGKMTIGDQCIYDNGWKVRDLRALRRDLIGFIFQAPYLIPFLVERRRTQTAAHHQDMQRALPDTVASRWRRQRDNLRPHRVAHPFAFLHGTGKTGHDAVGDAGQYAIGQPGAYRNGAD